MDMTSSVRISPESLEDDAKALEAEAAALEREGGDLLAAKNKLEEALAKRDHARFLRKQLLPGSFICTSLQPA